jgi:hypothetical protein
MRVGKVQRAVRRAFAASNAVPLRSHDLLQWAYPRVDHFRHDHYRALYQAAPRFAIKLGKDGKGVIWGPTRELEALIRGE